MNKQLIQQFLDKACYDDTAQQNLEDWCDVEKLAELIVRDIHAYVDGMDTAHVISTGILKRYGVTA